MSIRPQSWERRNSGHIGGNKLLSPSRVGADLVVDRVDLLRQLALLFSELTKEHIPFLMRELITLELTYQLDPLLLQIVKLPLPSNATLRLRRSELPKFVDGR